MIAVVAAIDFGTHGTGYAWTEVTERPDGTLEPVRREPNYKDDWRGPDSPYPKDLTAVLIGPDGEIAAWGHQARQEWADLPASGTAAGYGYVAGFKMALKADAYRGLSAPGAGTVRIDSVAKAYPLVVAYLRRMYQLALRDIQGSRYPENRIRWCLTVPAIWDDAEKQLMRDAAKEAGMPDDRDRLLLALEPEAAAVYCREHLAHVLGVAARQRRQVIEPGTRFMVVDCGGGTVDITAFRVTSSELGGDQLTEIGKVSGGKLGSEYINEEFVAQILPDRLGGADIVEQARATCPHALFELVQQWEGKKLTAEAVARPGYPPVVERPVYLPIPGEIRDLMPPGAVEALAARPGGSPHRIVVTPEEIKRLFDKVVVEILELVSRQLTEMRDRDGPSPGPERILLVGGLSRSKYLQESLRLLDRDAPGVELLLPANPAAAVLFGAVRYGCAPVGIARRARYTYGCKVMRPFESGSDRPGKRYQERPAGPVLARDRFRSFVTAGTSIEADRRITTELIPNRQDQARLVVEFYRTAGNEPRYVTDPGCQWVGNLCVELGAAMRRPLAERRVEVAIWFGDTDIHAAATNVHTKEQVATTLRFDEAGAGASPSGRSP